MSTAWPRPKFVCSLCGKSSGPEVPEHFCWSQFWHITIAAVTFLPVAVLFGLLLLSIFSPHHA